MKTQKQQLTEAQDALRTLLRILPEPPWWTVDGGSEWEPWAQWIAKEMSRLAAIDDARTRLHARFKTFVDGKCVCPYCSGDVEALAEIAAEYELQLDGAAGRLKAIARLVEISDLPFAQEIA